MISLRRTLSVFTMILAIGILLGCQNSPLEPQLETQPKPAMSIQYIQASSHALGLAKGKISTTALVDADEETVLGGDIMDGNAVIIPAGALEKDMTMTFTLEVTQDGILVFSVESPDMDAGEHIYFQDGKTSTLIVNGSWLAQQPDAAVNIESNEQFPAVQDGDSYHVNLPHFSSYAWVIMD